MQPRRVTLAAGADHAGFRQATRVLVRDGVAPRDVIWECGEPGLFAAASAQDAPALLLPRPVAELIATVICHRDPERYALLYALVWRVLHGERALLEVPSDALVHRLCMLEKAIRRDLHKMHAFVRFRKVDGADNMFAAWFEPDHFILEAVAEFFVARFTSMNWSIVTPIGALHWDGTQTTISPPGRREDVPAADGFEAGWRGYYESIFNPARLNPTMMRSEMPKKYWKNLPEAGAIRELIQTAPARVREMIEKEAAMSSKRNPDKAVADMFDQAPKNLAALNRMIVDAGPLVPGATQAVLGEGPAHAELLFVGEQPGDQEDIEGRPFVGPAGQLLSRAMADAGIDRSTAYLTNSVKHFKFEQQGKRRIHSKPNAGEVKHYRWWLMQEIGLVRPKIVVALGATAVLALLGKAIPVTKHRGPAEFGEWTGFITVHPSYLLRLPDEAAKRQAYADFVADLRKVKAMEGKVAKAS